jgi:ribosomal-protein-alanine N-acetyltransferase
MEKLVVSHVDSLFELLKDPDVLSTLTLKKAQSLDEMKKYVLFCDREWVMNNDFTYTIIKKPLNGKSDNNTPVPIGQISIYDMNFIHRRAEIGIWLGKPFWGHGYAKEALQRMILYAFGNLELNRLQAHIFPENIRSIHLFEKFRFKYEGINYQFVYKEGQFLDVVMYALLKAKNA